MAAKSKAKKSSAKAAKPAKVAAKAKSAPAKRRGEEISSDLRKVALAYALRRLR